MDMNFTDADISLFLKLVIELGGGNIVDDSPDKYVRLASTGKLETLTVEGRAMPLAIYGTRATDAIIINPFAEGESDSSKNLWFYSSRNVILSSLIIAIMRKLLTIGAETASKKKSDKEGETDNRAIGLLSKHILNIDDKTVKEFDSITKSFKDFFIIYYNKSTRQGEATCFVFNEMQRKAYPNVRVKSWEVFSGLLLDVLNVSDLSEFNYVPKMQGIPVLESFANILVTIYEHMEESLKVIDRPVSNTGTIRSHLKYLAQYAAKSRWCTGPQMATATPVGMPMPFQAMPNMMPQAVPYGAVGLPGMVNMGVPAMPGMMAPMAAMSGMSPVGAPMSGVMPMTQYPALQGMPVTQTMPTSRGTGNPEFANPFARPGQ